MGFFTDLITDAIRNRQVAKENANRRGVTEYKPSQIGGFVESDAYKANVICSGDIPDLRSDVITSLCITAANANIPVIVLHQGDTDMCAKLQAVFRNYHRYIEAGPNAKHYDPLYQLSNAMISKIIVDTSPKQYKMTSDGEAYINVMTGFLSGRNRMVTLDALYNCPHNRLPVLLSNAAAKQALPSTFVSGLQTELAQGQNESRKVRSYITELRKECDLLLPVNTSDYRDCISIFQAVRQKAVLNLDIIYDGNYLLLKIIAEQLKLLITQRTPFYLILDDLTIREDNALKELVSVKAKGINLAVVGEDVLTLCENDEKMFSTMIGRSSKWFVFHHSSGISAQNWSTAFTKYKKIEETVNYGRGSGSGSGFGYPANISWHKNRNDYQGIAYSNKDEDVVRADEITNLPGRGGFVYTALTREIAYINSFLPQ